MDKQDMALLIEVEDYLIRLDRVLQQLTGYGYADGDFAKLGNVYDVIYRNAKPYLPANVEWDVELYDIITNQELSCEERANILLSRHTKS